jgi:hypothetical protein
MNHSGLPQLRRPGQRRRSISSYPMIIAAVQSVPRRRRWPWVLLGLAGVVVLVLVTVAVVLVRAYGSSANAGEASPDAAAYGWVLAFNPGQRDDDVGISRLVASSRRGGLLRQRRDYIRAIETDAVEHGWSPVEFSTNGGREDTRELHGDAATAVLWIETEYRDSAHPGTTFVGVARQWRFQLRHDGGGWRVWSFDPPPWCDGYSTCEDPRPSSSAADPSSAPSSASDPLDSLPSPRACGPLDPLRELRSCSPSSNPTP